jgi:hypothetical protein
MCPPKWLERSEAELAAEEETQALRRAAHTRARLTEEERLVSRGALLEQTARGNLDAAGGNVELVAREKENLAVALAMQGRFTEAAKIHPDKLMRQHFKDIESAIEMDDAEKCDCKDFTGTVDGVEIAVTPRYSARTVYSTKHGEAVQLITCARCGHMNARKPRGRLLLASQNTGTGRQLRDSQILHANAGKTSD